MVERYIPDATQDLLRLRQCLADRQPFCFIRFSDGEIEVLRNRYLAIGNGVTVFRGRTFSNAFPDFDQKTFDPYLNADLRRDLLASAMFRADHYFKGIPTAHNNAVNDREFLLRLNGGMSEYMTFSDLLMNSNYVAFRTSLVPLFARVEHLAVIANYRASLSGELAHAIHITVGDDFFKSYQETLSSVLTQAKALPPGAVILSSASSLSNIVGYCLFSVRPDITFMDVGSSLNDLLGLDAKTRAYHQLYVTHGEGAGSKAARRYRRAREFMIKW